MTTAQQMAPIILRSPKVRHRNHPLTDAIPAPRARSMHASTRTDGQGRFELVALLPGEYALNVADRREPRALPPEPLAVHVGEREDPAGVRIALPGIQCKSLF